MNGSLEPVGEVTDQAPEEEPALQASGRILTPRALFLCLILGFITILWIRQVELIKMTCQISESVPPIPGVAILCLGAALVGGWRAALAWACRRRLLLGVAGVALLGLGLLFYPKQTWWAQGVATAVGVPAVLVLVVALFAPTLLRLRERLVLSRAEIMGVYTFVSVVAVFSSVGGMRLVLPCITALPYFTTSANNFEKLQPNLPTWFGPQDDEVLRQFFEGVDYERPAPSFGDLPIISNVLRGVWSVGGTHQLVPWSHWRTPLTAWFLFLFAFFITMLCIVSLFRDQWTRYERLGYPLVEFAFDMTRTEESLLSGKPFFRDTLMWCGIGASVLYNVMNLLNAINPSIPALGKTFHLGQFFTEYPLNAISGLTISYRPELVGLAFLVSLEILFSAWVFYALTLAELVLLVTLGARAPGMPFQTEQSAGSYFVLGLFLVWTARRPILAALRKQRPGETEICGPRWALLGAIVGSVFLVGYCVVAGMALWLAVAYMGLLLLFALVYARLRAETGAPLVWLFPYWQQEKMILQVVGLKRMAPGGDFRSATVLGAMMFLARGYMPTLMGTQLEGLRMTDEWRGTARQMVWVLLLAGALGLVGAGWMHLTTYYQYGGNVLEGGSTQGGYRISLAVEEYTGLANSLADPAGMDRARTEAHVAGAACTLALIIARKFLLRFPLHPLGFAMATAFGHTAWASFFFVWFIKSMVLRLGGIRLYRRLVPLFLGVALGHFFGAGVCLGIAGLWGGDLFMRYQVWFG